MHSSSGNRGLSGQRLYIAIAIWLFLILVGGLCTWYGWRGESSQQAPTPTGETTPTVEVTAVQPAPTTPTSPVEPTTGPPPEEVFGYGVAAHAVVGNTDYTMGQVKSLGLGWVKQQMRWAHVEPEQGKMEWDVYDWVVDAANKQGLKVMFSVVDAPNWTRSTPLGEGVRGSPPDDLTEFARFLGDLVDRYKGRVHAIEVWNEQNLDREWGNATGVSPEEYVEMLRLAYQAIESRDPSIIVISGALSPVGFTGTDPNNPARVTVMDDFEYFDGMLTAGLLDNCDCVGAHHNGINMPPNVAWDEGYNDPTASFRGPFDNPDHSWSFKSTLWGYHDRIVAAGGDKPLCITEFGWASAEGLGGYPPSFEFALDNTLEEQAQWDVEAFQEMREWGFVRLAFLWNLDFANKCNRDPTDPNAPYSLLDFDGAARPSFDAIGAMEKP